jgi:hypothetical protein
MFNSRHLVVALALVASAACSSSVDLTDPNVIAGELRGTWSRTFDAPGNSTVLQLSVHDSTITGTGTFAGEVGPTGTLTVTGKIVTGQFGPSVNIDFVQSNGPVGHFTGTLRAADMLDGSVWYSPTTGLGVGDPIVATFRRTSR